MKAFAITDVGEIRQTNQDYVFATEHPVGNLPNLFVVADGMGGHNAGDFASKYTVERLVYAIRHDEDTNPVRILRKAIDFANQELVKRAREDETKNGCGTTLVVAIVLKNYLYVANIGDSRLYVVGDDIRQITRDHSLVEEMVRLGELNKEEARNHPKRNVITRAIGADDRVIIDFFSRKLSLGDLVLMCSDGLSNMLEDEQIRQIMRQPLDIEAKALELIQKANRSGGRDNISVVIIEPEIGEAEG